MRSVNPTRPVRLLFAILALAATAASAAAPVPKDSDGLPLWQERRWTDFPVRIELDSAAALQDLLVRVPIDSFNREQVGRRRDADGRAVLVFRPRVTEEELAALEAAGFDVQRLPDREREGREAVERDWARRTIEPAPAIEAAPDPLGYYPTVEEVGQILTRLAADHPTLCRTVTWGQSLQGRPLYGLVLSADVNATAAEPEVRLSSTIHGNEPVGTVLLLDLALYLAGNYGQPGFEDVTDLVDGTEIHLLPLHNPDGYVAGVRNNLSNVDLNRNFPEPDGTHPGREPETLVYMDYAAAQHFVVGANVHTGAEVVNYAWDWTEVRAPDDLAYIDLSLEYSFYNPRLYDSIQFDQGITNGFDWYVATGTLQDWAYYTTGSLDVTLELSANKWPPASQLNAYWDENRESLLHFIRAARYGVGGVVTDAVTGLPLAAEISVAGIDKPAVTDPGHGDYVKLLPDGTWDVTVSADGYFPRTYEGVTTTRGAATLLDAALEPDTTATGTPRVRQPALQAWPNPFNGGTTVLYMTVAPGPVDVGLYDLRGRRVRTLVSANRTAGPHSERWDGRDDAGRELPSGVYVARLVAAGRQTSAKLLLAR